MSHFETLINTIYNSLKLIEKAPGELFSITTALIEEDNKKYRSLISDYTGKFDHLIKTIDKLMSMIEGHNIDQVEKKYLLDQYKGLRQKLSSHRKMVDDLNDLPEKYSIKNNRLKVLESHSKTLNDIVDQNKDLIKETVQPVFETEKLCVQGKRILFGKPQTSELVKAKDIGIDAKLLWNTIPENKNSTNTLYHYDILKDHIEAISPESLSDKSVISNVTLLKLKELLNDIAFTENIDFNKVSRQLQKELLTLDSERITDLDMQLNGQKSKVNILNFNGLRHFEESIGFYKDGKSVYVTYIAIERLTEKATIYSFSVNSADNLAEIVGDISHKLAYESARNRRWQSMNFIPAHKIRHEYLYEEVIEDLENSYEGNEKQQKIYQKRFELQKELEKKAYTALYEKAADTQSRLRSLHKEKKLKEEQERKLKEEQERKFKEETKEKAIKKDDALKKAQQELEAAKKKIKDLELEISKRSIKEDEPADLSKNHSVQSKTNQGVDYFKLLDEVDESKPLKQAIDIILNSDVAEKQAIEAVKALKEISTILGVNDRKHLSLRDFVAVLDELIKNAGDDVSKAVEKHTLSQANSRLDSLKMMKSVLLELETEITQAYKVVYLHNRKKLAEVAEGTQEIKQFYDNLSKNQIHHEAITFKDVLKSFFKISISDWRKGYIDISIFRVYVSRLTLNPLGLFNIFDVIRLNDQSEFIRLISHSAQKIFNNYSKKESLKQSISRSLAKSQIQALDKNKISKKVRLQNSDLSHNHTPGLVQNDSHYKGYRGTNVATASLPPHPEELLRRAFLEVCDDFRDLFVEQIKHEKDVIKNFVAKGKEVGSYLKNQAYLLPTRTKQGLVYSYNGAKILVKNGVYMVPRTTVSAVKFTAKTSLKAIGPFAGLVEVARVYSTYYKTKNPFLTVAHGTASALSMTVTSENLYKIGERSSNPLVSNVSKRALGVLGSRALATASSAYIVYSVSSSQRILQEDIPNWAAENRVLVNKLYVPYISEFFGYGALYMVKGLDYTIGDPINNLLISEKVISGYQDRHVLPFDAKVKEWLACAEQLSQSQEQYESYKEQIASLISGSEWEGKRKRVYEMFDYEWQKRVHSILREKGKLYGSGEVALSTQTNLTPSLSRYLQGQPILYVVKETKEYMPGLILDEYKAGMTGEAWKKDEDYNDLIDIGYRLRPHELDKLKISYGFRVVEVDEANFYKIVQTDKESWFNYSLTREGEEAWELFKSKMGISPHDNSVTFRAHMFERNYKSLIEHKKLNHQTEVESIAEQVKSLTSRAANWLSEGNYTQVKFDYAGGTYSPIIYKDISGLDLTSQDSDLSKTLYLKSTTRILYREVPFKERVRIEDYKADYYELTNVDGEIVAKGYGKEIYDYLKSHSDQVIVRSKRPGDYDVLRLNHILYDTSYGAVRSYTHPEMVDYVHSTGGDINRLLIVNKTETGKGIIYQLRHMQSGQIICEFSDLRSLTKMMMDQKRSDYILSYPSYEGLLGIFKQDLLVMRSEGSKGIISLEKKSNHSLSKNPFYLEMSSDGMYHLYKKDDQNSELIELVRSKNLADIDGHLSGYSRKKDVVVGRTADDKRLQFDILSHAILNAKSGFANHTSKEAKHLFGQYGYDAYWVNNDSVETLNGGQKEEGVYIVRNMNKQNLYVTDSNELLTGFKRQSKTYYIDWLSLEKQRLRAPNGGIIVEGSLEEVDKALSNIKASDQEYYIEVQEVVGLSEEENAMIMQDLPTPIKSFDLDKIKNMQPYENIKGKDFKYIDMGRPEKKINAFGGYKTQLDLSAYKTDLLLKK